MTTARLRLWILNGLNLLALTALVLFLLQKISATMYWVSSGFAVLTVIAAMLLIPLVALAMLILKRWSGAPPARWGKIYFRCSYVFLLLAWLGLSPIGTFWGAIFLHIWEPWPLSLAQGPDTERARDGFRRVFGFAPPESVHDIYYKGFALRDRSDYLRFSYGDPAVLQGIVESFDLVPLSDELRVAKRFTHLGEDDETAAWWAVGDLARASKVYVNRALRDSFEGSEAGYGVMRVLWVDEPGGLAYFAYHTFQSLLRAWTSDFDIYRTASALIREHGDEADLVAAQRADSFLEAGDVDGCSVWKRVLKAIKEIRREEPRETEVTSASAEGSIPSASPFDGAWFLEIGEAWYRGALQFTAPYQDNGFRQIVVSKARVSETFRVSLRRE